MTVPRLIVAVCAVALLLFLAAFGIIRQDVADPITTSAIPQPDWLFMFFFQVTRYFQGDMEMLGVFWLPLLIVLGLAAMPIVDRGEKRKAWIKWPLVTVGVLIFAGLNFVTFHSSTTIPVDSCAACHKEGFGETFATPPKKVAEFSTRYDNKWLALHYRYPQYFWMMDAEVPSW